MKSVFQEMAKRSTDAVREGRLTVKPEAGEKIYFYYLDNIRPWCISRQVRENKIFFLFSFVSTFM